MKRYLPSILIMLSVCASAFGQQKDGLTGAWQSTTEDGQLIMLIVSENHFAMTFFTLDPAEFISTMGGKWRRLSPDSVEISWEFNTANEDVVGTTTRNMAKVSGNELNGTDYSWTRLDDGGPGALAGAWLITGRQRDGEIQTRMPDARKTMKILSGTRFQWIAYNSETGEFFGTGAGTYTTDNGKYTEHIQVFSRDNSRVGASLEFEYELVDGEWHHSGLSSRGDPIYEVWSRRSKIGI